MCVFLSCLRIRSTHHVDDSSPVGLVTREIQIDSNEPICPAPPSARDCLVGSLFNLGEERVEFQTVFLTHDEVAKLRSPLSPSFFLSSPSGHIFLPLRIRANTPSYDMHPPTRRFFSFGDELKVRVARLRYWCLLWCLFTDLRHHHRVFWKDKRRDSMSACSCTPSDASHWLCSWSCHTCIRVDTCIDW